MDGDTGLMHYSKRQHSTSTSTPEAELVALNEITKNCILPLKQLLEDVLQRSVVAQAFKDKESCGIIVANECRQLGSEARSEAPSHSCTRRVSGSKSSSCFSCPQPLNEQMA